MKSIFYSLLVSVIVLTSFFSTVVVRENQAFDFFYSRPSVAFEYSDDFSGFEDFSKDLIAFSKEYEVNISQYVYYSEDKMFIYSTHIRADSSIHLKKGRLPEGVEFIASIDKMGVEPEQSGVISYPKKGEFYIYNFEQVKNVGYDNTFFFSSNDVRALNAFVDQFSKYGKITMSNQSDLRLKALLPVFKEYETLLLITVVVFAGLFTMLFLWIIQERNAFFIAELWGYTFFRQVFSFMNLPIKYCAAMTLLYAIGLLVWHAFLRNMNYITGQLFALFMVNLINLGLLFLGTTVAIYAVKKLISHPSQSKGKLPYKKIVWMTVVFKLAIAFLIVSAVLTAITNKAYVQSSLDGLKYWNQAKDVYKITVNFPKSQLNVWAFERDMNDRFLSLYQAGRLSHGMFIMDSNNFFPYDSDNGNPVYAYTMTVTGEEAIYSHRGRSVTIDGNYLQKNPIVLSDGKDVQTKLSQNQNTLNILVPEQYYIYEDKIKKAYLEFFYFQKVEVANIYNKELGLALNKQSIEELSIRILYTKKNQKYFTFNSRTGDSKNEVVDPIAIIFNESMDTSFLSAMMTSSTFFSDSSEGRAYENIQPLLEAHEITEIGYVESVYSHVIGTVYKLKDRYVNALIMLITSLVFSCLIHYLMVLSYFQLYKYRITLQYISGYSSFYSLKALLFIALTTNIGVGIPFIMSHGLSTVGSIICVLSVADSILIYFANGYLCKTKTISILKGDTI